MQRQLKFRAWNVREGSMFLDEDFSVSKNGKILFFENGDSYDIPTEYEINQWTGLLDKNGNEIYEGDLIKDIVDIVGEVKYGIQGCDDCMAAYGFGTDKNQMLDGYGGVEIIGNIYSNPELI